MGNKVALQIVGVLLIIVGVLLLPGAAVMVMILPDMFSSTVRMVSNPTMTDPVQITREMEKIKSRPILATVVTNLNLNKTWAQKFKADDLPTDAIVSLISRQLELRQSRNTRFFSITVFSEDKNEAALIANEITRVYLILSRGADGKAQAEIIEGAQPGLRPVRRQHIRGVALALVVAIAFVSLGGYLIVLSKKPDPVPPRS